MSNIISRSLRETSGPPAAVEIAGHRVSGASLEWRGGEPVIAAHAVEALPEGALAPSLASHNIHDRAAVAAAVGRVLERIGRPRRVGLVVPDLVAKVSLVRFAQVPPREQDLEQLVRWQIKKTTPFSIEEAQVSYVPGVNSAEGHEFLVLVARRDVVEEYEGVCAAAGANAGVVDLATFNIINAVLAQSARPPAGGTAAAAPAPAASADWLLVNVAVEYTSIALMRGPHVIFFRNRTADSDGTLADLVHQSAMYYEDRLQGGGLSRVILAGAAENSIRKADEVDELRRSLEERIQTPVESIDPRGAAALTDRITAAPALLDTLSPLVGLLLRHREAAA